MSVNPGLFSSAKDDWTTPDDLFAELNGWARFTCDVAASRENAKCPKFYDRETNGLMQDWSKDRNFMNPPYGREIGLWVNKAAITEYEKGCFTVGLLPARTDTRWFHDNIWDGTATPWLISRPYEDVEVRFLRGRLKFGGSKNSAPFPSMIVVWGNP